MLRELPHVRQLPDDYFRRCFVDEGLDLVVWYKPDESIHGFQICYETDRNSRAVTWTETRGMAHSIVDDGEHSPFANRSPMLRRCSSVDTQKLLADFDSVAESLPLREKEFIQQRLAQAIPA